MNECEPLLPGARGAVEGGQVFPTPRTGGGGGGGAAAGAGAKWGERGRVWQTLLKMTFNASANPRFLSYFAPAWMFGALSAGP